MMNSVIIAGLLLVFALVVYFLFFRKAKEFVEVVEDKDTIEYLKRGVMKTFDDILKTNYAEMNLHKDEIEKAETNKTKLRKNMKLCKFGNYAAKLYVKDYIRDLLSRKFGVSEENINNFIPFDSWNLLTSQDKWEILIYIYKKNFGLKAVQVFIDKRGLAEPKHTADGDIYYEISVTDLNSAFIKHSKAVQALSFTDKLDILAQRVYQETYGNGVVDDIRDMVVDGFNCGTSGISTATYEHGRSATFGAEKDELPLATYNAVWLMLHGKKIRLACIGFGSQRELERVSKNIYRYGDPGTLSMSAPKIIAEGQDGCRITVARPPFTSSWVFCVRKFDTASKMAFSDMYPYAGVGDLELLCQMIMSGCCNTAVTGQQATGKTTFLMNMCRFFQSSYSVRTQEAAFELNLQKIYPRRNIIAFRETPTVTGQMGIDFQKKTDGDINLIGEVADYIMAMLGIQTGMVGSAQTVFTHHAKNPRDLVTYFRDAMIVQGGFNNEKLAENTVVNVLRINVNIIRTPEGKRIIDRVTEIIPTPIEDYPTDLTAATIEYYRRQTDRPTFVAQDLIVGDVENGFRFCGEFSPELKATIRSKLPEGLVKRFDELCEKMHQGAVVNHALATYKDPFRDINKNASVAKGVLDSSIMNSDKVVNPAVGVPSTIMDLSELESA